MGRGITPMGPVELTDLELDAVAGGAHGDQHRQGGNTQEGLINVGNVLVDADIAANVAALNAAPVLQGVI